MDLISKHPFCPSCFAEQIENFFLLILILQNHFKVDVIVWPVYGSYRIVNMLKYDHWTREGDLPELRGVEYWIYDWDSKSLVKQLQSTKTAS